MRYFYIQLTANAAADYRGVIFYSLLLHAVCDGFHTRQSRDSILPLADSMHPTGD